MDPYESIAITGVVPAKASSADPGENGVLSETSGFCTPSRTCTELVPAPLAATVHSAAPGPSSASSSSPLLTASATSAGAESGPPACDVATAMRPSLPL